MQLKIKALSIVISVLPILACQPQGSGNGNDTGESVTTFDMTETVYNVQGFWDFESDGSNAIQGNAVFNLGTATASNGLLTSDGVYGFNGGEDPHVTDDGFDLDQMTVAIRYKHDEIDTNIWEPVIVLGSSYRILTIENQSGYYRLNLNNQDYYTEISAPVNDGWHTLIVSFDKAAKKIGFSLDNQYIHTESLPSDFVWNFENNPPAYSLKDLSLQHTSTTARFKGQVDWILWVNGVVQPSTVMSIVDDYR